MRDTSAIATALFALTAALGTLAVPEPATAADVQLGLDWSTSPSAAEERVDARMESDDWRDFARRSRRVTLNGESWTRVLVFYKNELIAQGYHRTERPESLRGATISDMVSYDNNYWMARTLSSKFGDPDFKDVRTKTEYSEELGDPETRAHRSVQWDLKGERFRWETDGGTVRYAVRYSLKGQRDHYLVRVKPGAEKHYHFYRIGRAFRRAGIQVVRRFERKSRKMVVALVTSSGEVVKSEYDKKGKKLVPVQPKKRQFTARNCKIQGTDCRVTYHTYGGWIYRVDLDLSTSGRVGRTERSGFAKIGKRAYRKFLRINGDLEKRHGTPRTDNSISDLKNDRNEYKVEDIPKGRQAFWTVWYEPADDVLIRHVISGGQSGSNWHVDHRVTFRLHSVARAFAAESAWRAEAQQIEQARQVRDEIREEMKKKTDESGSKPEGDK